jgi:hypothetical protein
MPWREVVTVELRQQFCTEGCEGQRTVLPAAPGEYQIDHVTGLRYKRPRAVPQLVRRSVPRQAQRKSRPPVGPNALSASPQMWSPTHWMSRWWTPLT